jgi:hypothetical protein
MLPGILLSAHSGYVCWKPGDEREMEIIIPGGGSFISGLAVVELTRDILPRFCKTLFHPLFTICALETKRS